MEIMSLLSLAALLFSNPAPSLAGPNDIPGMKKMKKAEIVKIAEHKIKKQVSPLFSQRNYERIEVMAGKDTIAVSFFMPIKYVPLYSEHIYDITLLLSGNEQLSYSTLSNPEKYRAKDKPGFFTPSRTSRKAVDFVLKAVNASSEVGHIDDKKLPPGTGMTIFEQEDCYRVEVLSNSTESSYKIKKGTGAVFDARHNHLVEEPVEKEKDRQEIK